LVRTSYLEKFKIQTVGAANEDEGGEDRSALPQGLKAGSHKAKKAPPFFSKVGLFRLFTRDLDYFCGGWAWA
jgi:hypothetical protein